MRRATGYTKSGPYFPRLFARCGLSEQPAGHSASVNDLRRGVISSVVTEFVNKLLTECSKAHQIVTFIVRPETRTFGVKELGPWPTNWGVVKDLKEIPDALALSVVLG
jgi:hypothetical protein